MQLVFWQNILSPHQAPFLRALAALGHDVAVVASETMTADRIALGWKAPNLGQSRIVIAPDEAKVRHLVENSSREAIHILAGARWSLLGNQVVRLCLAKNCRMGIMSESPDPRGILGYGRWAKYAFERFTKGFHYDFVLAMGEMGVKWFCRCGYPPRKVFPFAYVTETARPSDTMGSRSVPAFLFAGHFIARKGLDLFLRAFAAVPSKNAQLRLIGEGPEKERLERLAQELGIQSRVIWLAKRDQAGVQSEMEKADVTFLPSHHDGWGAVVNESLTVGTPVICSSACGAAELVRQPWLGTVFRSGNVEDLANAIKYCIMPGSGSPADGERIRNWAKCISGESVAGYFAALMDHIFSNAARPVPPWRLEDPKSEVEKIPSAGFCLNTTPQT